MNDYTRQHYTQIHYRRSGDVLLAILLVAVLAVLPVFLALFLMYKCGKQCYFIIREIQLGRMTREDGTGRIILFTLLALAIGAAGCWVMFFLWVRPY